VGHAAGITVRNARAGDGPALARIHLANNAYHRELAPELFRKVEEDSLAEFMDPEPDSNTDTSLALVAELDGEVAGYLEAQLQPPLETAQFQGSSEHAETKLFINFVGTEPRFWRRGVAGSLVEAAEEWGRGRGATVALCDTWIGSPVSMPFWEERMGYERRSVRFRKVL
jgi:GNAT superfamily N-acetyltransferase